MFLSLSRALTKRIDRINVHWIRVPWSSRFSQAIESSRVRNASRVPQTLLPPDQRPKYPSTFSHSATHEIPIFRYQLQGPPPTEMIVRSKFHFLHRLMSFMQCWSGYQRDLPRVCGGAIGLVAGESQMLLCASAATQTPSEAHLAQHSQCFV